MRQIQIRVSDEDRELVDAFMKSLSSFDESLSMSESRGAAVKAAILMAVEIGGLRSEYQKRVDEVSSLNSEILDLKSSIASLKDKVQMHRDMANKLTDVFVYAVGGKPHDFSDGGIVSGDD